MRFLLYGLCICASVGAAASAQLQWKTRPPGTASISGRVVDALSGVALGGAKVSLHEINPPVGFTWVNTSTTADAAGGFAFADLPNGTFTLYAEHDGYLTGGYGDRRPSETQQWLKLDAGQRLENAVIGLWHHPTITGHVKDEKNRPLIDVTVEAWRCTTGTGPPRCSDIRPSFRTGADGSYRLTRLLPGEYMIVLRPWRYTLAARSPETRAVLIPRTYSVDLPRGFWKPEPDVNGRALTWDMTFAPDARDSTQAAIYRIGPGDLLNLDLVARTVVGARVTGRVTRPSGGPVGNASTVTLRPIVSPETATVATTWIQSDHTFTFLEVPPGRYIAEVTLNDTWGSHGLTRLLGAVTRRPIEVRPDGLDGLEMAIDEGSSGRGRVVFLGNGPRPQVDFALVSVDHPSRWPSPMDGIVNGERTTFQFTGVEADRYRFNVSTARIAGWGTESMTLNGRDLGLELVEPSGSDIGEFVVTMTDRPATLDGVVSRAGSAVPDATVVAFPVESRAWPQAHRYMARYVSTRATGGRFRFSALLPGDYFVVAVDEREMENWPAEPMLRGLSQLATRTRVASGTAQTLSLELRERRR
jgi:hypothetical protein